MQYYQLSQKSKTEEYYNDILNKILFDTPIKFLHKYPEIQTYTTIIQSQKQIQMLIDQFISSKVDSDQSLNQFFMNKADTIKTDILKILRKIFKLKIHQIKKRMIDKYIAMDGNLLVNFNWKVNIIVSHNSNTKCMIPICCLQLIIKVKELAQEKKIIIELQKQELNDLIEKLKKIQVNFR